MLYIMYLNDDNVSEWLVFPGFRKFSPEQAIESNGHKGEGEQLSLVEVDDGLHLLFPRFLHLFEVFHKESEGEDAGEAESKEKARSHFVRPFAIEPECDKEEDEIGNGFVELSRVSGKVFSEFFEDEAPSAVCLLTHDFGVHQIAQSYATRCDGCGNGDVVDHSEEWHFGFAHIEP